MGESMSGTRTYEMKGRLFIAIAKENYRVIFDDRYEKRLLMNNLILSTRRPPQSQA